MKNDILPFKIGSFDCFAIRDGDDWDRNVLLIKAGGQQILIDTGVGGGMYAPAALLPDRLRQAGIPPAAIDLVILSHADFDHIGGTIDESGSLAFPNARYVLPRAEWDFWCRKPERLKPSDAYDEAFRRMANDIAQTRLTQLSDQLEFVEPETEVAPGIHIIAAPGHTPGYTIITLSSGDEKFIYIGDLIYDPKDIRDPDGYSVFDFDPQQVVVTRNMVFEQAAREDALLMASHLPFPGLGYVSKQEKGWGWQAFDGKNPKGR